MNYIKFTDDFHEAVEIGKRIFNDKPDIYVQSLVEYLYNEIDNHRPELSQTEREKLFYHSIYDYWAYGAIIIEEFYYDFLNKTDKEKKEYVTAMDRVNVYAKYLNNPNDKWILENKYETYKKFKEFYKRDVILIKDNSDFAAFEEFVNKHSEFVVKPLSLRCGVGIHKVTIDTTDDIHICFDKLLVEGKSFVDEAGRPTGNEILIEEVIHQSDELSRLHPYSVNCIRVTTIRVDDKVHILYPWIKVGTGGNFIASSFCGALNALIDSNTGVLMTDGKDESGRCEEYHPDSMIKFRGYQIPRWNELIEIVSKAAMMIPSIRYIGWDFALTNDGWAMLEGNYNGDFSWQFMLGKGTKNEFEELISWKPEKKFWWE